MNGVYYTLLKEARFKFTNICKFLQQVNNTMKFNIFIKQKMNKCVHQTLKAVRSSHIKLLGK